MTTKVTTFAPDDDLALALALQMMLWSSVRHLPVVEDSKLVGLVTDHGLLPMRRDPLVEGHLRQRVREVMHRPVKTIHPDEDARVAAALMATVHIHCLPVVRGDELVGIVTSSDLLAGNGRPLLGSERVPSVTEVMTRSPVRFRADDRLFEVVLRMMREGVRHVPIVDVDERVVGIVSDQDVRVVLGDPLHALSHSEELDLDELTASHAMTPRPVLVRAAASLGELARLLLDEEIGAAPVMDGERRLVGMVSYVDLLRFVFAGRWPLVGPSPR